MSTHAKSLKLVLGAAAIAVLAAGAATLAPNAARSTFAATPAPVPATVLHSQPITPISFLPVSGGPVQGPNAPRINGLDQSLVQPGGFITIAGSQFGAESPADSISLEWTNVVVNNAFTKNHQLSLPVIDWQDTRVVAQVPTGVEGVPDELAHVVLTTPNGQMSSDIQFVATRATMVLSSVPNYQTNDWVISCSAASDNDHCFGDGATHNDFGLYNLGVVGTDSYQFKLTNGWILYQMDFHNLAGTTQLRDEPVRGDTTLSFSVDWFFNNFDTWAQYSFQITVYGPKGVPLS